MLQQQVTKHRCKGFRTCARRMFRRVAPRMCVPASVPPCNRREYFLLANTALGASFFLSHGALALPLGPLGPVTRIGGDKLVGLSPPEIKDTLKADLEQRQYFVTGNLTKEIFADDCRFIDPTNDVTGLSKYVKALEVLFDPEYSKVQLLDIQVTGDSTIEAKWILGGYLRFPWHPKVSPFEGRSVYSLNSDGLIQEQKQTWSKSAGEALLESFTPTLAPRQLM